MKGQEQTKPEETVVSAVKKILQRIEPSLLNEIRSENFKYVGNNIYVNNKVKQILESLYEINAIPKYNFIAMINYANHHQSNIAIIILNIDYFDDILKFQSLNKIFGIKHLLVSDEAKQKFNTVCNSLYQTNIEKACGVNQLESILRECPKSYPAYNEGIKKLIVEYDIIAKQLTERDDILRFLESLKASDINLNNTGPGYVFIKKYEKKCLLMEIEKNPSRDKLLKLRNDVTLSGYIDLIGICNQKIEESIDKDMRKELNDQEMVDLYKCTTDPSKKEAFLLKCLLGFAPNSIYYGFIYQELTTSDPYSPKGNSKISLAKKKLITSFLKLTKHKNLSQICKIIDEITLKGAYDRVLGAIISNNLALNVINKSIKSSSKEHLFDALQSFRLCGDVTIYVRIITRFFESTPTYDEIVIFANYLLCAERFFPNIMERFNKMLDDYLENKAQNSDSITDLQSIFRIVKDNVYCPKTNARIVQKLFIIDSY